MSLTAEAVEILMGSPWVASATEKTVRFTEEFKKGFCGNHKEGMAAPLVLEQLGIDLELLGVCSE